MNIDDYIEFIQKFPVKKRVILRGIAEGLSQRAATALAGLDEKTYYNYYKKDVEFRKAVAEARETSIDGLEDVLKAMAYDPKNPKNFLSIRLLLQARRPDVYGQRQTIVTQNPEPIKIIYEDNQTPSDPNPNNAM